jgi:hypothetical protein
MQKPRNPLDDCLRILVGFGSLTGIYAIYRFFELTGSTITQQDIRFLITLSITIVILAIAIFFAYLILFVSERLLGVFGQFKKIKNPDKSAPEMERLGHLELTMVSALERLENRLTSLEGRISEERALPAAYEMNSRELGY